MENRKVIKRDGRIVDFDANRIQTAIEKAVQAVGEDISQEEIAAATKDIVKEIQQRFSESYPSVEQIQDMVEKNLMKNQWFTVAKAYIVYRAEHTKQREKQQTLQPKESRFMVTKRDGRQEPFDENKIRKSLERKTKGLEDSIDLKRVTEEVKKNCFAGIPTSEIEKALIMAANSFIELDPAYSQLAGRLYLQRIYKEAMGHSMMDENLPALYRQAFIEGIQAGIRTEQLDKRLGEFDLEKLAARLEPERDLLLEFLGIQTLYDRYFFKVEGKRAELPQAFWMRVAMGLSVNEKEKEERAAEFYEFMSQLYYVPSTPTLFHSGLTHPQLSSCYLTTVMDDLDHIFKCLADNARLSKWSGGLGNDWSNIRGTGAAIKSTQVESQGVIPFLKIANDVTCAINRSGKRRGATCAYLETWHLDIEDFLDLRRNTGDERRRTHDMNTANWIPDLFMKRMMNNENWTLFSPDETPELHHVYGKAFETKYIEYEQKAEQGQINKYKTLPAQKIWRQMLSRLFETGHPWMTFKDPSNIRSPQDHAGVIHSSNLCTEITLNTSEEETAVCNLGSVNLEKHVDKNGIDFKQLQQTVRTAIRMLDNVIDINFYPTIEAQNSNMRHRPIGLGVMGFQDALFKMRIPFDSEQAIQFSDEIMEFISYYAVLSSSELAKEKGKYESFPGSKWERGIFPLDTLDLLEHERGQKIEVDRSQNMNWQFVKDHVKKFGMRNSNTMAIAPTATIANIAGCFPCTEPIYKNIYVKANLSGEFTIVNKYLIEDLKKTGSWNKEMLDQIKYYDGNIQLIPGIPAKLKTLYKEAFEIDPIHCIEIAARRSKWIDQSQSHNVFMKGASGKKLNDIYIEAWKRGLKTTYYLRTLGASQIEKSTLDAGKFGFTQKRSYQPLPGETAAASTETIAEPVENAEQTVVVAKSLKVCSIDDPDCEACQ